MYWYIDLLRYKNRSSRITNSSSPFCWSESANCKTFRESPFVHSFLPAGRRVERQASSSGLVCPFLLRFQKPLCVFKNEFSYPARIKTNAFPVISSSVSFRCWPLRPPAASIISCRESTGFSPDKGSEKCIKPFLLFYLSGFCYFYLEYKYLMHDSFCVVPSKCQRTMKWWCRWFLCGLRDTSKQLHPLDWERMSLSLLSNRSENKC